MKFNMASRPSGDHGLTCIETYLASIEFSLINGDPAPFERFKRETTHSLPDGVYIQYDEPRRVALIDTDVDLTDFKVANGGFSGKKYELLSYTTDDRELADATPYMAPSTALPRSETHGYEQLEPQGKAFGNIPPALPDYVPRPELEAEIGRVLADDRHPVITLAGRGGIGKTSTALQVLHQVADSGQFFTIIWFSSRDIDLLPQGPKLVQPRILTVADIANVYADLVHSAEERSSKMVTSVDRLGQALGDKLTKIPTLFVFDNFETVRHPVEMYQWLDTYIRLPNKVLITTRLRDFRGDYPIEVGGMTESEFAILVERTASRLRIAEILTPDYLRHLFEECDGHPYVAKILLGEVALKGRLVQVEQLMANKDEVLDALFERTYSQLPPAAQRVFLTLSNWRSTVPQLALEATLLRPENEKLDVPQALNALLLSSMIQAVPSSDGEWFLQVPLAASLFGKRKLTTSPLRTAVEADTKILHEFGAGRATDIARGLAPRVRKLFSHVATRVQDGEVGALESALPILEYVARRYPPGWLELADLYAETDDVASDKSRSLAALERYVEARPDDRNGWIRLAALRREAGDQFGALEAQIELACQKRTPFPDVSNTANRMNSFFREGSTKLGSTEKRVMLERLRDVMVRRIAEANATDCSRLAWLCVQLGDVPAAHAYVSRGLNMEPENEHCRALTERLRKE